MLKEVPDNHAAMLRTALKQEEETPLPDNVTEIYWKVASTARRFHEPMTNALLILVLALADRTTPEDPVSFLNVIEADQIKKDDRVLAKFRNKWRWGFYQGYKDRDKKVQVQIDDGNAEIRSISLINVRLPSREELQSIGA